MSIVRVAIICFRSLHACVHTTTNSILNPVGVNIESTAHLAYDNLTPVHDVENHVNRSGYVTGRCTTPTNIPQLLTTALFLNRKSSLKHDRLHTRTQLESKMRRIDYLLRLDPALICDTTPHILIKPPPVLSTQPFLDPTGFILKQRPSGYDSSPFPQSTTPT